MQPSLIRITCWTTVVFCVVGLSARKAAIAVTFDWVTVGNPGNDADTLVMTKGPAADLTTGYGSVGYEYRIARK